MTLVFMLEESSMREFLKGIMNQIVPEGTVVMFVAHEGKDDLLKSIPVKLRAWNTPDTKFVIVLDQDNQDCYSLKKQILKMNKYQKDVLVRIACQELESWYFGAPDAIGAAYHMDFKKIIRKKKYREPDLIVNPKEELRRFIPQHQQLAGARRIAERFDVESNRSKSFQVFRDGIRRFMLNDHSCPD